MERHEGRENNYPQLLSYLPRRSSCLSFQYLLLLPHQLQPFHVAINYHLVCCRRGKYSEDKRIRRDKPMITREEVGKEIWVRGREAL